MRSASHTPRGGAYLRRFTYYTGFFFDEFSADSSWIKEQALLRLPILEGVRSLVIKGDYRVHPEASGPEKDLPGMTVRVNGKIRAALREGRPGPWELKIPLPENRRATLLLRINGVGFTNFLAWLGRITHFPFWQRFRAQNKNRQLRISTVATDTGEVIYDFSQRTAPFSAAFLRRHAKLGLNIVGFLTADLGVGESARCMVRAADAAGLPTALVPLRLHCKNRQGDLSYAERLQDNNPHAVNVIHLDPPAARDLDHHHGPKFRTGKYNIGYFAWELPEFPDGWVPNFDYFDEIWCPSDFTRQSIEMKSPVPVLKMPHAIAFPRPVESAAMLRSRFGLPQEKYLFLSIIDLNSYAARKNPRAAFAAFRESGLATYGAALIVKVQNALGNPIDFNWLQNAVKEIPGTRLITETLSRSDIYALESACDCFVSLHRSEGFGLAVAESMYLGKPVVSTNWSATAEFVDASTGCPVEYDLVTLDQHHGPYVKGSIWAEPNIAHAASCMRKLFNDRNYSAALGAAARQRMESEYFPTVIGTRYRRRLEGIAGF